MLKSHKNIMKLVTVVALLSLTTLFLMMPGRTEAEKGPLVTDVVSVALLTVFRCFILTEVNLQNLIRFRL